MVKLTERFVLDLGVVGSVWIFDIDAAALAVPGRRVGSEQH